MCLNYPGKSIIIFILNKNTFVILQHLSHEQTFLFLKSNLILSFIYCNYLLLLSKGPNITAGQFFFFFFLDKNSILLCICYLRNRFRVSISTISVICNDDTKRNNIP